MDKMSGKLTVYFEDPFWVGVFEKVSDEKLSVSKMTFGSEPKDNEVRDFILKHYNELKFSPAVEVKLKKTADNPKRRQRNAAKQLQNTGIGTKSQQALQKQREEMKVERRQNKKEMREADRQKQYELKQQKKKEKHKG
ncbi:MAG: YjdF family protein, partial [Oribacterium sp.]|nr:YjdF family protein [Oribacterium sp.]